MSAIPMPPRVSSRLQKGAATLMVALVILVILTVIVLASTNVALFEQRTATNENRQRLADQVARYSLNLGGEFLKANIVKVGSLELGGWLATNTRRWTACNTVSGFDDNTMADRSDGRPHPCMAEPDPARRGTMYFYNFADAATDDDTLIPYDSLVPNAGKIETAGGSAGFGAASRVRALLCRIDTTLLDGSGNPEPACALTPTVGSQNRIAVTIISSSELADENAAGEAKETWASFSSVASSSTVPLVASGSVDGVGNVTIVTDPDGAGIGLPVSIWSRSDADVDKTAGGSAASVGTCQLGDYLNKPYRDHGNAPTAESELKTTCVTDNNACGCPAPHDGGTDFLSGKIPGSSPACCENVDILDIDAGKGSPNPIPDIQFFPGKGYDHLVGDAPNTAASNASALSDDSLFEWVFGVSNESESTKSPVNGTGNTLTNCGSSNNQNCAIWLLTQPDQLNAQVMTCAQFGAIGPEAAGLYYISDSGSLAAGGNGCTMPAQVGSPAAQAIVVVDDEAKLNNTKFFGMFFVRSNTKTAFFRGNGNSIVIGSVVVEGTTDIAGSLHIVYDPTQTNSAGKDFPLGTRLGRVSGSWLDNNRGGF
jgi:hypothetical protein